MFNYRTPKKPNNRYRYEENIPKIIEKMYNIGGKFSYENNNSQMNYTIKLNNLKLSSKSLNIQVKSYGDDIDNIYNDNNLISTQLRNNYKNLKKELNNNIDTIKLKIDEHSLEQTKKHQQLKKDLFDLRSSNYDIQKLINDLSEKLDKIHNKMLDKQYNINNKDNKNTIITNSELEK